MTAFTTALPTNLLSRFQIYPTNNINWTIEFLLRLLNSLGSL